MASIRDLLHLRIFEKGIQRPVNNLANMIGGDSKYRALYRGNYYDTEDEAELMTLQTRQEMDDRAEWLKNNRAGYSCFGDSYGRIDCEDVY